MEKYQFFPCRTNEALLLVTSYHQGQMTGCLSSPRMESPAEVQSVPQLLFLLDDLSSREDRTISHYAFDPAWMDGIPSVATLKIRVLFHEHHTRQGSVLWEDQRKEAAFRSVWELIQILDEILID